MTKSIAAEACSYNSAATHGRPSRRAPLVRRFAFPLVAAAIGTASACAAIVPPKTLDDFQDPSAWNALASDQVSASLRPLATDDGKALCLAYDFNGVSGYAAMRRELPLTFPPNYEFDFRVRGRGPANAFEFKLIDASGDNVWWVSKANTTFSEEWTPVRYKKRHIAPAWGPLADKTLRQTQFIEFTISANTGGRGEVCVDDLRFREREVAPSSWPRPKLGASSGRVPPTLFDGMASAGAEWRSKASGKPQSVTADFGRAREFGGLVLHWLPEVFASRYDIEVSDDGRRWKTLRQVVAGNGGIDALDLAEAEARYLRIAMTDGPGRAFGLSAVEVRGLAFGASRNAFLQALADMAPPGRFPRGFSGQQTYWTLVGLDGGHDSGLVGEDGAIEVARGGFSITPFVVDGHDCNAHADAQAQPSREAGAAPGNWASARISQVLAEGYLPIPGVILHGTTATPDRPDCTPSPAADRANPATPSAPAQAWRLEVDAFARGDAQDSGLLASYTLANAGEGALALSLALAIQPFQVNPPVQFLTTPGGVSPIHALAFDGQAVRVDGKPRIWPLARPTRFFATPFDNDMVAAHLAAGAWPTAQETRDESGLASAALVYRIELAPGASRTITLEIPLHGVAQAGRRDGDAVQASVPTQRAQVADAWREKLNRVTFSVPPAAQPLIDTLRTALAHILISRDGVQIRPGTRSYARSWIRDGAMTAEALLRMGHAREARDFLEWFAPYQFESGKVPCCVDARGSDPVPENDSHGELVYLIGEVVRYTQDKALAERMWPHVDKATRYMDSLRASERNEANHGTEKYGLLPPSISHEGYSAKPAYSHWDNFWGLTGYESAIELAKMLGRDDDVVRLTASRDEFRADILASLEASTKKFGIDFIPGAADLGDFDATSTTIALSPGGQLDQLPADLVRNTFERYWQEFVARRDGTREWKDYTPYEWRNVAAFVRLGWKERAHEAIDFFFKDRRPLAWNQWAEVVGRDYREPRFIGDMPHGWVASDFIRSALDLFAYERASDDATVLAAGLPADWLAGTGVAIAGLQTRHGPLGYRLSADARQLRMTVEADNRRMPAGGYVLAWPFAGEPGPTRVNGRTVAWTAGELRIDRVPAQIVASRAAAPASPAR